MAPPLGTRVRLWAKIIANIARPLRRGSACRLVCVAVVALGVGTACGGAQGGPQAPGQTGPGPRTVAQLTLPANPAPKTVHVPILTYHRVHVFQTERTKSIPDQTVEPAEFAHQMDALAQGGFQTISQTQLYNAMFRGQALPPKPVLITVDDGYSDDVTDILPVLQSHHMVATFYIITGRFHEQGFLDENAVRKLDQAGMDIGAHTRTHVDLPKAGPNQQHDQIVGSRDDLQRVLGHPVYYFAYPYGTSSPAVVDELRKAGFVLAVTTQGGTQESSLASLTMPRIHVGRNSTTQNILACTSPQASCGGRD